MSLLRCCQHYAWLAFLVCRRLHRLMFGLSCPHVCGAAVAIFGSVSVVPVALRRDSAVAGPAPMVGRAALVGAAATWSGVCARVCAAPWGGVLCWCVALLLGQVCFAGPRTTLWLGLLCWCLASLMVWRAVLVPGPPHAGACCVGAWPTSWWDMLCWCAAHLIVGVLCWCLIPLMVGRAVLACGPPHGGACCVGAWPASWSGVPC